MEDPALVGVRVFQHGVEGGDDRHAHPAEEGEDVAPGRPAEDAEFVLQAEHIHVGEVEEVGRAHIGGNVGLGDFEADFGRVGIVSGVVGDCDDRAVPTRIGRHDGIAQVAGEGGDAALPRRIVTEKSDFVDRRKRSHQPHCGAQGGCANGKLPPGPMVNSRLPCRGGRPTTNLGRAARVQPWLAGVSPADA